MVFSVFTVDKSPLPDWYLDVGAFWEKIDSYVLNLREKFPEMDVWKDLEDKPISKEFIDGLVSAGSKVRYDLEPLSPIVGAVDYNRNIRLSSLLKYYKRDKTFFHELAHLRHPVSLSSRTTKDSRIRCEREIIVEWLGRKARADPELLRHAVFAFGLDAHIYDRPSYAAFNGVKGQQSFPFMAGEYKTIMMD